MDKESPVNNEQYRDVPAWVSYEEKQKIEISNDLGMFDKNELAVFFAISEYADKYKTSYLPLQHLYKYLYEYGLKMNINSLKVEDNIVNLLRKVYFYLHRKNYCASEMKDNKITAIILTDPQSLKPEEIEALVFRLKKEYEQIKEDAEKPFPIGDSIPKSGLSSKVVNIVSIRELTNQKINAFTNKAPLTKILFPSNNDIVFPTDELSQLYEIAFNKLKKLLLRNRDIGMLVLSKIKQRYSSLSHIRHIEDVINSDNIDSNFWISFTTELIESALPAEKEEAIYQCAEIVKYLSILKGEEGQKKGNLEKSTEIILKVMETYPIQFSKSQILKLREKHPYLKLLSERDYIDLVNNIVKTKTVPESVDVPPALIPIKVGEDFRYLHRENFPTLFFDKIDSIAYEIKKELNEKMDKEKEAFLKNPIMKNPELFYNYVEEYFSKQDPFIVQTVENKPLLYSLLVYFGRKNKDIEQQINRFFYPPSAENEVPRSRMISDVLLISWEKIVKEVKLRTPIIFKIPLIGLILKLLMGFGRYMGKAVESQLEEKKRRDSLMDKEIKEIKEKKKEDKFKRNKKEEMPKKAISAEEKEKLHKQQILSFQKQLIGDRDPKEMLAYYESRWNRVLNAEARSANVEFVRAKIKNRLGFLKSITPEVIKEETANLIKTETVFKKISDLDSLKRYIALYMAYYYLNKK